MGCVTLRDIDGSDAIVQVKKGSMFDHSDMPDSGWWEALWPDPASVVRDIGVRPEFDVIDLCAGEGWFTLQLAKNAKHVSAIDLDAERLGIARHRLDESGVRNCTFITGDAAKVSSLVEQPADFVFLANVFHGVADKPGLARTVWSALKPGGMFAVVNWHARPKEETRVLGRPRGPETTVRMTPPQTIEAVEPSGFMISNFADVSPHHYAVVFERQPG